MSSEELAKDVTGAEALLERHQVPELYTHTHTGPPLSILAVTPPPFLDIHAVAQYSVYVCLEVE